MEDEKISISLADVKHLQLQFAKDATEKLDLYLPTTDTSDPLKSTVASLVDDFIYEIFENAKGGLDVDGMRESDELRSLLDNPTKGMFYSNVVGRY
jgi:kinetochor protein Mis14/NSL1